MSRKRETGARVLTLSDETLRRMAIDRAGIKDAGIIAPSEVQTAPWVRLKCQFGCDGYGRCLVCPPFTPTAEETRKVLDAYHRAILIHFDPEADVKAAVADLEREIFLAGAWKAFGLGAGPCYFCAKCPVDQGPCRHAERARPAMEACGIDVFATVKKAGFAIEVVKSTRQCPHYYGLLLVD